MEEQIAIINGLSPTEQQGLGSICVNLDQGVPKDVLRNLLIKELIVKTSNGHYEVASFWVHYAWCQWCSRQEEQEETEPSNDYGQS